MVRHIVFFKLKDNSESIKQEVKKQLLSLKDSINILQSVEVGFNFSKEERAYDIALITDFNSKEDLTTYATHPAHLEVIKYIKTVAIDTKVVDYQY